jgi:hypothetical protein
MSEDETVDIVPLRRMEAQSGKVSYGEPITLHESSKSRIVLVPFYIPRTQGTELAIKIVSYRKANTTGFGLDWEEQDKTISLNNAASRALLKALKEHFAVGEFNETGDYIAIRVANGVADVADIDPRVVADAVASLLSKTEIVEHLSTKELGQELIAAFKGAIRLQELRNAVIQLRQFLDNGETDEAIYQRWCEQHSWAFGNAYVVRDPVRQISLGDKVDLLLPTVVAGYRDLVELKRPDIQLLKFDTSHKNFFLSSDASKAIGQCHRYLDVLANEASKGLLDHPEVVAYHPRATIVMGRSAGWSTEKFKALHGLNARLSGITLMTYDQLLAQGERLVEVLTENATDGKEENDNLTSELELWDDL